MNFQIFLSIYFSIFSRVLLHILDILLHNREYPAGAAQYIHTVDRSILLLAPGLVHLFFLFLSSYHLVIVMYLVLDAIVYYVFYFAFYVIFLSKIFYYHRPLP